jgi:hypothetical protein
MLDFDSVHIQPGIRVDCGFTGDTPARCCRITDAGRMVGGDQLGQLH